ncbi:hypothetical protein EV13_2544 [Prochlorococcus sp. MIT 0702]|nr:hypothetical protein EV12_2333 [Prochlorococcus sp. MIT 0701]KGG26410.1 hypothetical protein EV13_2544 [Prochlorococcus sp. MIT 0702]KGG31168.1 hypothetical protein EV14_2539 [Prochlorococcus sp. MIT 0703]
MLMIIQWLLSSARSGRASVAVPNPVCHLKVLLWKLVS